MKVGFDIRPALYSAAGIGRYARELGAALTHLDDAPDLALYAAAWRGGPISIDGLDPAHCRMHRGILPARAMNLVHRIPGWDAGRFPSKVDVFHWTDYVYPQVRSAASVLTLHDAAFAVDPTYHGRNTSVLMQRVRQAITQATLVVVVSESARRDAEMIGVHPEKVRVVPNGVSADFRPAARKSSERNGYLLTVGTLEPRKNYPRVLAALESLWDDELGPDWYVVGREGWDYEEFLERMERSRHRKRIRWIRNATDEELLRYYQGATALLYPSLHEGFGLPVLEAMACGIPVIVGRDTAPAEVAGVAGLRVDPVNVDSIAAGVERILTDPHWSKQASAVLELRAREFTWEAAARKTMKVYREAIELHAQRR